MGVANDATDAVIPPYAPSKHYPGPWTGRPGDRVTFRWRQGKVPRKVRAPQSKVVGNTHPEQSAGQCHREQTASSLSRDEVRVKRWSKRPPAPRATGTARQTPPGARPDSMRSRAARPSTRVGRWRSPATAVVDGWSPMTEPGLQVGPSLIPPLTCGFSAARHCRVPTESPRAKPGPLVRDGVRLGRPSTRACRQRLADLGRSGDLRRGHVGQFRLRAGSAGASWVGSVVGSGLGSASGSVGICADWVVTLSAQLARRLSWT
jgi:hypothetical protein